MKKRKLGRKLLSFLLTLAMVVGLLPGMGMTTEAATIQYDDYLVEVTNHNQNFIDAGICDQTTGLKCKPLSVETAKALENYLKSKTGSKVAVIYGCTVRSEHPGWSRISFVIDGTTAENYYMDASIARAISNRGARNEAEYKLFYVNTDAPDFETANETVTFKVINGQWDDGTTEDVTVSLSGLKDEIRLAADQIPAVGTKPNDTYKAGSWDVTPSADTAITAATTYTYTYVQKSSITPTVSIEGWTYGEAAKAPSVNGNTGNGTVTYTYAKKGTTDFSSTVPSAAGEYTVKAVIAETDDYLSAEATADFTIAKANATVSVPTPKTLTYNGYAQELVNEGSATGGTMKYAVTTENKAPTDENLYTTSIPTGTEAGTYYVWYKVVGDSNYLDSDAGYVTVTIATAESSDSGSGDSSGGSSDNTNTNTDASAKVPYEEVAISTGSVKDITGTAAATAESNPFGTKIENNNNLTTLLSLTDEEVAQGVNVWLDVQDMSASVPQADKTLIQNTSGDYTVGLYLDINLFKKVGSNDATKVTETNGKVKASIVIPESLWKSGRIFEIIRVHDGVATAIAGTYDENTHVFTFETDKFSTYALAYKDPASSSNSGTTLNSSNSTQSTAPKTGDSNDVRVWYLLLMASLGGLGFWGLSKKKEN